MGIDLKLVVAARLSFVVGLGIAGRLRNGWRIRVDYGCRTYDYKRSLVSYI